MSVWRDLVAVRAPNRWQRRVRRVSSGSRDSFSSWLVWLGCHRPVMAAMTTCSALAKALDCATVILECQKGAWYSRCTLPSVCQNCVSVAVSTPKAFIRLSVRNFYLWEHFTILTIVVSKSDLLRIFSVQSHNRLKFPYYRKRGSRLNTWRHFWKKTLNVKVLPSVHVITLSHRINTVLPICSFLKKPTVHGFNSTFQEDWMCQLVTLNISIYGQVSMSVCT